jgi:Protein of unknown function C-terminus (DUF2399)
MSGLRDVPDGLVAWAQPAVTAAGPRTDRKGRQKVSLLRLRSAEPGPPVRPNGLLSDSEWNWAIGASREWRSVVNRFGSRAGSVAEALTRANCVNLEHAFQAGVMVKPAKRWVPHESLLLEHSQRKDSRRTERGELADIAGRLRSHLEPDWPGVAASLQLAVQDQTLLWAVRAAQDLLDGRSHDGPRAFVQAHAGDTKAREDLPQLLRGLGWEPRALTLIGVGRSPYLGISGPLRAHLNDRVIDVTGWPGPHDLRLPPDGRPRLELTYPASQALVIENRQAAEALADEFPDLPLIWCHGQPPPRAMAMIRDVAEAVAMTAICPDADLGGVRIAARITDYLPVHVQRQIVDAGDASLVLGRKFGSSALAALSDLARRPDQVGRFASACYDRGYRVEQEAAVRACVRRYLS